MIRLKPLPKPEQLTAEKQEELTRKFIEEETSVWQQSYIKDALLEMSNSKCCYCECKLNEESKYLEVEHFYPKGTYPGKVVEWKNLLPSCKRCNTKKGEHDTRLNPIVHPVKDDPVEHLFFKCYQIRAKHASPLGEVTVEVLDLNDTHRLTFKRFQVGEKLIQSLDALNQRVIEYTGACPLDTRRKNRLYRELENLLLEGHPRSEYSACAATVILNEEYYQNIKSNFITHNLWDENLQRLEGDVKSCALDI